MARVARIVVADVAHHVTQRGNGRQFILATDAERARPSAEDRRSAPLVDAQSINQHHEQRGIINGEYRTCPRFSCPRFSLSPFFPVFPFFRFENGAPEYENCEDFASNYGHHDMEFGF